MHAAVPLDYGEGNGWECRTCGEPTTEPGAGARHLSEPAPLPPVNAPIVAPATTVNGIRAALAAAPRAGTLRAQVIAAITTSPMTDDELEVALSRTHQSVSACRNRLVADGWLEPLTTLGVPVVRKTRTGNDATVWTLTPAARDNLGVAA